jgi:hypothetical protein
MALKPPARGGSSSGTRQGITRRRRRLGELLVAQTYGDAASSVLADWVLASASNDKTGTVTGTTTFTGIIAGRKSTTGTVTGTITFTGTITGKEGSPGVVTGSTTYSGTVAGTKAAQGVTASDIVYSGVITGTAFDPTPPATDDGPTGSGYYPRREAPPKRKPAPIRKSGKVSGVIALSGVIAGRKAATGRALAEPLTYRAHVTGTAHRAGTIHARTETRGRIHAEAVSMHSHAELRRLRDDYDLLQLI